MSVKNQWSQSFVDIALKFNRYFFKDSDNFG